MRGTERLSSQFVGCEARGQSVWDGWRGQEMLLPLCAACGWFPVMPLNNPPAVQIVPEFSNEAHRDPIVPGSCKVSYADYDSTSRRQP
jgi:hypothetical protein